MIEILTLLMFISMFVVYAIAIAFIPIIIYELVKEAKEERYKKNIRKLKK